MNNNGNTNHARRGVPQHHNTGLHSSSMEGGSQYTLPDRASGTSHYRGPHDWSFSFLAQAPEKMACAIAQSSLTHLRNLLASLRLLTAVFHKEYPQPVEGMELSGIAQQGLAMGLLRKVKQGNAAHAFAGLKGSGVDVEVRDFRGAPWYEGFRSFMDLTIKSMINKKPELSHTLANHRPNEVGLWHVDDQGVVQPIAAETLLEYMALGHEALEALATTPLELTDRCPAVILHCTVPGAETDGELYSEGKNLRKKFADVPDYSRHRGPVYRYLVASTPDGGLKVDRVIPDVPSIQQHARLKPSRFGGVHGALLHEAVELPVISHMPGNLAAFLQRPEIQNIYGEQFKFWLSAPVAKSFTAEVMGYTIGVSLFASVRANMRTVGPMLGDHDMQAQVEALMAPPNPELFTFPTLLGEGSAETPAVPDEAEKVDVESPVAVSEETPVSEEEATPAETEEPQPAETPAEGETEPETQPDEVAEEETAAAVE